MVTCTAMPVHWSLPIPLSLVCYWYPFTKDKVWVCCLPLQCDSWTKVQYILVWIIEIVLCDWSPSFELFLRWLEHAAPVSCFPSQTWLKLILISGHGGTTTFPCAEVTLWLSLNVCIFCGCLTTTLSASSASKQEGCQDVLRDGTVTAWTGQQISGMKRRPLGR